MDPHFLLSFDPISICCLIPFPIGLSFFMSSSF
jgi:hypothetical protein